MSRRLTMTVLAGFGTLLVGLGLPGVASAATALPLTGETLISTPAPPNGGGPVTDVHGSCVANGSTFTYSISGVAAGPYPGTFIESGSFTLATSTSDLPPSGFTGAITDFHASFTITSVLGTISGTKDLPTGVNGVGFCFDYSGAPFDQPGAFAGQTIADTQYNATITLPDGSKYADSGTSNVQFNYCNQGTGCGTSASNQFTETYVSTGLVLITPPPPVVPTSKDQCKNGGYKNYPALGFKNQGDCVSFVATGGRNGPAL
jgi:hypothetical protein